MGLALGMGGPRAAGDVEPHEIRTAATISMMSRDGNGIGTTADASSQSTFSNASAILDSPSDLDGQILGDVLQLDYAS